MKLIGKTRFSNETYEDIFKNGDCIWVKANEEEFVENIGIVRKIYFEVVDKTKALNGIKGEYVLKDNLLIFLNIVYENGANYAEFYIGDENVPEKVFIRDDNKLYLKDNHTFFEVETSIEKIGIDSPVSFISKTDEYKYNKSTDKIGADRIIFLDVLKNFTKVAL